MKGIFIFLPPIAFALMYIVAMFSFGFDSVKAYAFGLVALLFTSSSNIYNRWMASLIYTKKPYIRGF